MSFSPVLADATAAAATGFLVLVAVVSVALVVFCVAALVSVVRCPSLNTEQRVLWVVAVLVFQFLGPLLWFTVGKRRTTAAAR